MNPLTLKTVEYLQKVIDSATWECEEDKRTALYVAEQITNGLGIEKVSAREIRIIKEANIWGAFLQAAKKW